MTVTREIQSALPRGSRPERVEEASEADGAWKSDHRIVPMKPGNSGGGKAVTPPLRVEGASAVHRDGAPVELRLARIRQRARAHRKEAFNNLFTHMDGEMLLYALEQLEDGKAAGEDGISVEEYEKGLEARLTSLLDRLHRETYRPQPSRRRWIPKGDGRQRPLGIPATEDKIVQRALAGVLTEVYEEEFHKCSYGFRPGRGCHDALRGLGRHIAQDRVNWVVEADIKGFYDNVDHEWLLKMVTLRVSDERVLRLIRRMLEAGVMEEGRRLETEKGTPQGGVMTPRTQKVTSVVSEVIGATRRREAASVGRSRWHGDAVADHDRVIADEHLLDDQSHEALPLENVERIGGYAQPNEKCRERLRQAQVGCSLTSLLGDRLQLDAQRLLALAQWRHPLSQVLQRQKILLIGSEHPLDALAHSEQIPLHRLFALLRGIGGTSRVEPTIEFLLNQGRIFEQPNDLGPDDLIQQILPHGSVVTAGTAEVSPPIRADAAIVVDQARSGPGRRAREGIAAPAAAHQTLHDARLDRPSPCPDFVLVQQFLRMRKGRLSDERRYWNLDPLFTRPLVVGAVATRHAAPQSQRPRHTLARGHTGLAEAA